MWLLGGSRPTPSSSAVLGRPWSWYQGVSSCTHSLDRLKRRGRGRGRGLTPSARCPRAERGDWRDRGQRLRVPVQWLEVRAPGGLRVSPRLAGSRADVSTGGLPGADSGTQQKSNHLIKPHVRLLKPLPPFDESKILVLYLPSGKPYRPGRSSLKRSFFET